MTLELNRIYCMDCLEGMRQMDDKSVDLVITDPPYGINVDKNSNSVWGNRENKRKDPTWLKFKPKEYLEIGWDEKSPRKEYFDEILRISKNQIIWGGIYFADILPKSPSWIIWDKKQTMPSLSKCELAWCSIGSHLEVFYYLWSGYAKEEPEERVHPTQKPIKLFEWIIKNYAKEGDIICDPFFGSGSCLVACIRMGHQFIGFEKERTYFDAAQLRIKRAQEQGKISGWFE
jgi:site-specific DNA-methyltransferase (adenine-specific)